MEGIVITWPMVFLVGIVAVFFATLAVILLNACTGAPVELTFWKWQIKIGGKKAR